MDSDVSESNFVINTNKDRFKRCLNTHKRTLLVVIIPLIFIPIACVGQNNAYKSFYIFLVSATFFSGDILHPGVSSFLPIVLFTIMGGLNWTLISTINLSSSVLDCLGAMAIILAIEHSTIHKRVALKVLLLFGSSHFRLSFALFVSATMLSMWFGECMACGLMMPLVKAILKELEKMGILETNDISVDNEKLIPRPSEFTIFYFIGIAYSSTIGGMATFLGSKTNQIFINFCTALLPSGPKLESPHFLLLTLPGVIILEMNLYLWLNFYFLGILRIQNYTALQATLTSDEEQFISVLLTGQYQQMGKIKFHEMVVGSTLVLAGALQAIFSSSTPVNIGEKFQSRLSPSMPSLICVFILLVAPNNLDCLKFFKKSNDESESLPSSPSEGCLTWKMIKNHIDWSTIFLTASANITFDSLEESEMTVEFQKFLSLFSICPASAQAFFVIVFCKMLTEFASNDTVARCIMKHIANVGVNSKVNPLYLMLSATLSTSLPFHLTTGTPSYAMISSYVHIPKRKMMIAGIGPSVLAIAMNLFTVQVWSKLIWPDIDTYSAWANGTIHKI